MDDPWMEWESDPKAMSLLGHYFPSEGTAQPRKEADAYLAFSQAENSPNDPDRHNWEITGHAALIALGYLEMVSTESSPRGKPMGYKITAPGLLKATQWATQEPEGSSDKG